MAKDVSRYRLPPDNEPEENEAVHTILRLCGELSDRYEWTIEDFRNLIGIFADEQNAVANAQV